VRPVDYVILVWMLAVNVWLTICTVKMFGQHKR
jgi:hypothetical protein